MVHLKPRGNKLMIDIVGISASLILNVFEEQVQGNSWALARKTNGLTGPSFQV